MPAKWKSEAIASRKAAEKTSLVGSGIPYVHNILSRAGMTKKAAQSTGLRLRAGIDWLMRIT